MAREKKTKQVKKSKKAPKKVPKKVKSREMVVRKAKKGKVVKRQAKNIKEWKKLTITGDGAPTAPFGAIHFTPEESSEFLITRLQQVYSDAPINDVSLPGERINLLGPQKIANFRH